MSPHNGKVPTENESPGVSALRQLLFLESQGTESSPHRANFNKDDVLIQKNFLFDQSPLDKTGDYRQKGQEFRGFRFVLLSSDCDITINQFFISQKDLMTLILSFSHILPDAESRKDHQNQFRIGDDVRGINQHNKHFSEKLESLIGCIDEPSSLEKINIDITFAGKILTGFVEKQDLKSIIDDISKPSTDNRLLGLKIEKLLDSISIEEDSTYKSPSKINRSSILEEFKSSVQSKINLVVPLETVEDQSSSDEEDLYVIDGDPKKIEQDPDRGLYTPYNTANNPQPITRVTIKKPLDEDEDVDIAKREDVDIAESIKNAIKSSITHMNRYFYPREHDSIKIRFYKFFLIAIKVNGVSRNKLEYQNKLDEEFSKEEFGELDSENFYKKALMLSNAFQKEIIKFNIFTGRIGQDETPKKDGSETEIAIVGMRSARIPIDLLTSIAHEELDEEQFREFCLSKFRLGLQKEDEELSSMPRTPQRTTSSEIGGLKTVLSQRRGATPWQKESSPKESQEDNAKDQVQKKLFPSPASSEAQSSQAKHSNQPSGSLQLINGQPPSLPQRSSSLNPY